MWPLILTMAVVFTGLFLEVRRYAAVSTGEYNYRVYVAGLGTVEGKWSGETGIAVIGLETRPAPRQGEELKVIDLLIANKSSAKRMFNSDITLVSPDGARYGLRARGQPEVIINPGAISQGTVIINVPRGLPEDGWLLEIKGGNLQETVLLPLRVARAGSP